MGKFQTYMALRKRENPPIHHLNKKITWEHNIGPSGKAKKFEITTVVTTEKSFGKIEITTMEELFDRLARQKRFEITTVVTTTEKPFGKIEITTLEELFGPSGKAKKFKITTVVTTREELFGKIEITTTEELFGSLARPKRSGSPQRPWRKMTWRRKMKHTVGYKK